MNVIKKQKENLKMENISLLLNMIKSKQPITIILQILAISYRLKEINKKNQNLEYAIQNMIDN